MNTHSEELVVLASADGKAIGTEPKATVHHANTPLHFAFSCYVRRADGKVLITRRALSKKTWPGVWTNSMCGHPGPDEQPDAALLRRSLQELGIDGKHLSNVRCILPDFSYRAVDSSGIVEWELCPVFVADLDPALDDIAPLDEEVDSHSWVEPGKLVAAVAATPFAFSPWMCEQLAHADLRRAIGAE